MIRVTAAVLEHAGKILIARRGPGQHLAGQWEFPGGKIEKGESPEECLRRELREEFCIEAQVGECLGSQVHTYSDKTIELIAYRTTYSGGQFHLSCHDEVQWIAPHELSQYGFAEADHFIVTLLQTEP